MTASVLGIVGGSGFYHLPGLANPEWKTIESPWGAPSDEVLFADIDGLPIRFLRDTGAAISFRRPASTIGRTSTS